MVRAMAAERQTGRKAGPMLGWRERCEALFEGLNRSRLIGADLPCGNGSNVVVFVADGRAGKAAEHGELTGMGERVGDRALEEALDGGAQL